MKKSLAAIPVLLVTLAYQVFFWDPQTDSGGTARFDGATAQPDTPNTLADPETPPAPRTARERSLFSERPVHLLLPAEVVSTPVSSVIAEAPPAIAPSERGDEIPPDFELSGISIVAGDALAVISGQDGRRTMRVGEEIDAWKLRAIAPRHVVLRRDGRDHTVKFRMFDDTEVRSSQAPSETINQLQNDANISVPVTTEAARQRALTRLNERRATRLRRTGEAQ